MKQHTYNYPKKAWNNKFPESLEHITSAGNHLWEAIRAAWIAIFSTLKGTLYEGLWKEVFGNMIRTIQKEPRDNTAAKIMGQDLNKAVQQIIWTLETSKYYPHSISREKGVLPEVLHTIYHIIASTYNAIYSLADRADVWIANGIINHTKKKNREHQDNPDYKEKNDNRLKKLIRENTIKALIAATVASGVGYEGTKVIQDMFPQGKEIIIETSKLPFEKHHLSFRDDNPDFFADKFGDTLHKETIAKGITIIRDAGLTFYVLQPEDCTKKLLWNGETFRQHLVNKLSNIPEFAYLKKVPINDKTKSFNILTSAIATKQEYIQKGQFYIPLPLDPQVRKISIQDGANYCYEAIQELKNGGVYQKKMEELLTLYNKDENRLIADILAFFRSETSEEYTQFIQPLWATELHRREEGYQAFSYSYGHILMEKNADGSDWPWLKARKKLNLTEGQTYHPKNSAKLFLWYRFEKTKNLATYFPLTNSTTPLAGKTYNGSTQYNERLIPNRKYTTNVMKNIK